jgi:outer membrane protein TolC
VDRAEGAVQQRRQILDATVRQLEILMGKYPAAAFELAEDLPDAPRGVPAGLPAELVSRRPDLVAQERRLLAADARIAQSKAALRPSFSLTGATGTATNQLQELLNGQVFVWSLIGGLTQPIFNNGRLKAEVRQSEARAREAAALYENAALNAYREVEVALAADRFLSEQEAALDTATRQAIKAQDLAEERYRSGLADIITVLDAQRTAIESESQWLAVRRARLDNRVDLHLALGGSFAMDSASMAPPQPTEVRETL